MSTFSGYIPELPGIAIDCFEEHARSKGHVFFLSHCHADHMRGLALDAPLPGPLYLSPVSSVLIRHRYPVHANIVRSLSAREQLALTINPLSGEEKYELYVRTVPAEHCPGSVMFYFETKSIRVLYTGDFRLTEQTRFTMQQAHIRPLVVYLDSTFLNSEYAYFPSRDESTRQIVSLCSEWLAANKRNIVSLWLPANYGSEDLFQQLYEQLHEKIHINESQRGPYMHFLALNEILTNDNAARIHACNGILQPQRGLPCRKITENEDETIFIRTIRPSALRWRGLQRHEPCWKQSDRLFYVCYSAHASYNELAQFIRSLQPDARDIRFNVIMNEADRIQKEHHKAAILDGEHYNPISSSNIYQTINEQEDDQEMSNSLHLERIMYKTHVNLTENDDSEDIDDCPYNQFTKRLRTE
ncbi:protein artemis-like [Anopheles nili]|uniref:protein artemis-like n=1 Tax=Anopheles nili TaxID=185578 RepID=UPI00237AF02A|nr:protein artemis-like [Anopheles nili]